MTKTRKLSFIFLIAVLCVTLTAVAYLTFNVFSLAGAIEVVATADDGSTEVVHNHTWSHEDATPITSASSTLSSGMYFLDSNVKLSGNLYITGGGTVEICLNGYMLIGNGDGSVITVGNFMDDNVTLALNDCCPGETCAESEHHHDYMVNEDGLFTFSAVTIADGTIYGGLITGGDASSGGGIYVYQGAFIMNGGSISGNASYYGGGGVYVWSGSFTMSGGSISGNTAENNGGGVYVDNGTFMMTGGSISSNISYGAGGGVYVESGTFTMNDGTISNNSAHAGGGVVVYSGTFTMNGGVIECNEAIIGGGGVCVENGSFEMNAGTISGNNTDMYGGGVYVGYDSTFEMNDGTISENTTENGSGGGVYVHLGSFTMIGGSISGNTAFSCGGVYVTESTFIMNDGTISGNESDGEGGGVCVENDSSFEMKGGSIYGNTAGFGGGVNVADTFTMDGGSIYGNTAYAGGGVMVNFDGTFEMNGGSIYGNTAYFGGGVYVVDTFTMDGGSISENSAFMVGGVFAVGSVELSGTPTIYGNSNDNLVTIMTIITIIGELKDGANVHVSVGVILDDDTILEDGTWILGNGTGAFTSGYSTYNEASPLKYFHADNGCEIELREGEAYLTDVLHEHTWGEGEVTKESTETEEGERTFTCSVCGATRTESIDTLPQDTTSENTGNGATTSDETNPKSCNNWWWILLVILVVLATVTTITVIYYKRRKANKGQGK